MERQNRVVIICLDKLKKSSFGRLPGIFHYMNGIPFGYTVSLRSQSSTKAFRFLLLFF